jgi:hypothetical protein
MTGVMAEAARATPRRTPYELVFVDGAHEDDDFPAIAREAEERGVDAALPERLLLLESAGRLLRALRPDEANALPATGEYGALLFHGFHFWRAGRPLFVIEAGTLHGLLTSPRRVGAWELAAPAASGYVQLPRHLVWVPGVEGATPEPVDGFFWTIAPAVSGAGRRLLLALVIGMRPGRPGFGIVAVEAPVPAGPAAHWADQSARTDGADFANVLPGGELGGLFALTSIAEALRLASLVFHRAAAESPARASERRPEADEDGSPHRVDATSLPYRILADASDG